MSISAVYELAEGSPKWAVTIRSTDHVGQHRFHHREDAEAFRLGALEPPDRLDAALARANAALEAAEPNGCHEALAELAGAVETDLYVRGRA